MQQPVAWMHIDANGGAMFFRKPTTLDGCVPLYRESSDAINADLLAALQLLVADVTEYEAWERPCHAVDVARAAIAKATEPKS